MQALIGLGQASCRYKRLICRTKNSAALYYVFDFVAFSTNRSMQALLMDWISLQAFCPTKLPNKPEHHAACKDEHRTFELIELAADVLETFEYGRIIMCVCSLPLIVQFKHGRLDQASPYPSGRKALRFIFYRSGYEWIEPDHAWIGKNGV